MLKEKGHSNMAKEANMRDFGNGQKDGFGVHKWAF